jgi:hypothetical protein
VKEKDFDRETLRRCARRVRQLELAIQNYLDAYDDSEMSNAAEALEHLRLLMARI